MYIYSTSIYTQLLQIYMRMYGTNHPQLKWFTRVTRNMHVTRGVTHKSMCNLDSKYVYTHTQYLHTRVCLYGYCSYS